MKMIAKNAAIASEAVPQNTVRRMIPAVSSPATSAAATYLQMAAIKAETPNPIGRPAYQKPGIRRAQ